MFKPETKVLIIDDMMTMRKIVKKTLADFGFKNLEEADDGNKAWTKITTAGDFGLIVSDWNMPNCTGLELLKRVRADAKFKGLPFILLTAEGEVSQVKDALIAGVDGYVLKPFTPDALREQILKSAQKRGIAAA